jgi:exosortase
LSDGRRTDAPGGGSISRRTALRTGIVLALWIGLYLPQFGYLARSVWSQEKYSHGWLIPVVSAGWVFAHRKRLASLHSRPAGGGLVLVLLGLLLWIYAQNKEFNALAHVSMLLTLSGIVAFAGGFRRLSALGFPVLYLVFMFPVPRRLDDLYVVGPLQRFAAWVAEAAIRAVSIPVVREGNIIEVPGIRLFVEEACSGIHSLYSLLALGTAVAFIFRYRSFVRILLILATIPIAIFANVVRVAGTGILAHAVSVKAAEGFSHFVAGLVVFALGLVIFLGLAAAMGAIFPVRGEGRAP